MHVVAAIMLALALVIAGCVLMVVAVMAVRDWMRAAADIAARRRRVLSERTDG